MTKRKVKLKITTARRQTIRILGEVLRTHCPECEQEVEMITEAEAAGILEVDHETLDAMVAAGQVHSIQTVSGGKIRVCKESLFRKR